MTDKLGRKLWVLVVAMVIGMVLCYAFGTAWFCFQQVQALLKL